MLRGGGGTEDHGGMGRRRLRRAWRAGRRGTAARDRLYGHGMARLASMAVVACAVLVTACTAGHSAAVAGAGTASASTAQAGSHSVQAGVPARRPPVQGAGHVSGGCGSSPLLLGAAPGWASSANPPRIRYALAERGQVAGFLFGYPLMAGNPARLGQDLVGCRFRPGRHAAAADRPSAGCRRACGLFGLAGGFGAGGDLPFRGHGPFGRLLAVHAVLERAHGYR